MSYTKNTWANGDVITAAKMNNMENGIEAASSDRYDIVICCADNYFDVGSNYYSIINGSYDDIVNKIKNNELITGMAYCAYNYDETTSANDVYTAVFLNYVDWNEYNESITARFIRINYINVSNTVLTGMGITQIDITISPNNTITNVIYRAGSKAFS